MLRQSDTASAHADARVDPPPIDGSFARNETHSSF
jgi:hypothetical protein